jgi:hypothetical protein
MGDDWRVCILFGDLPGQLTADQVYTRYPASAKEAAEQEAAEQESFRQGAYLCIGQPPRRSGTGQLEQYRVHLGGSQRRIG